MYSYSEPKRRFSYDVHGEIEVQPDCVVFPIYITTKGKTHQEATDNCRNIIVKIEKDIPALGAEVASLELGGSVERHKSKVISFAKDKKHCETSLTVVLRAALVDGDSFWQRAQLVAKILDFLQGFIDQYKNNEKTSFRSAEAQYHVDDKEQYRSKIIEIIYDKIMTMAEVIGKKEGKAAIVKEVFFNAKIEANAININKAVLSIQSSFDISLVEKSKTAEPS